MAHHGYQHEKFLDLSDEQQVEVIERSQAAFSRVLGVTATGYRTPTGDWAASTPRILNELGFRYSSSLRDSHTPYLHVIDGARTQLVEIPARVDFDDYAYFAYSRDPDYPSSGDRIASYRVAQDNFLCEVDGHRQVGGCLITTLHPKVTGTPGRARIVAEVCRRLVEAGDVWVTTADAVARHAAGELG
jgi:peptidoglycan/xylan/chitin deacetylase (PgdA/CDA1 family)